MFRLMQLPEYSDFKRRMINDTTRMKCLMFNLISECEGVKFEACLHLSVYVENFDDIENIEMKKLIAKNKRNFLMAIQGVEFDRFD